MKALDVSLSPLIAKSLARAREQRDEVIGVSKSDLKLIKTKEEAANTVQDFDESLNLHGIPNNEMTPAIKQALDSLMDEVRTLRSERVRLKEALRIAESLADTDPLTNVLNARAFLREMGRVMAFGQRYDIPSCLLYFDLNGFKAINDTFGHAAGDEIIKAFCDVLRKNTRESDVIGRVGGDEFAVMLAKANYDEGKSKAQQLRSEILNLRVNYGNSTLNIGATIGVYSIDRLDTPQSALTRADEAMYQGKISHRIQLL